VGRRNIVQQYALETGSEQGFGIGEKVDHDRVDRPDDAAFIEAFGQYGDACVRCSC